MNDQEKFLYTQKGIKRKNLFELTILFNVFNAIYTRAVCFFYLYIHIHNNYSTLKTEDM